jgi:serine/threonine-protein kinase
VVDVPDVGTAGSVIDLVMEYLEGEDLARLIARKGYLSPTEAADIMLPVAAAIHTAHQQGVIHRDLKPENIFLERTAYGAIQPKVLDFGISKVLGDSRARALTGTAATMGTMYYLPPEQLRAAREADGRSDQYGLGTILYECVTGQRAFDEESFYILLKKIAEGEYPRPSTRRPDLPPRLEAIIMRAMSLEPADRFDSVEQFGASLLDFASVGMRALWTPLFGAAPAVELPPSSPPRAVTGSGADRGRVATRIAPSQPAVGATMELPAPPRKASSTTLRNATGERALPVTFVPRRSRAPLAVAGVALVSAAVVLIVLRGGGAPDRRGAGDPASLETPATPGAAAAVTSPAVQEAPPVVRAPEPEPPTPPPPAATRVPAAKPAAPATSTTALEDEAAPRKTTGKGTHKAGARGGRTRGGQTKRDGPAMPAARPAPSNEARSEMKSTGSNDSPVIP